MQDLLRHNGIGSLPSATTTACSARTAALPGLAVLAGIALYNPASATTVSKTSSTLFIGGGLLRANFARCEVYAQLTLLAQQGLWIILDF